MQIAGVDIKDRDEWLESKGWDAERRAEYKRKRSEMKVKALKALAKENAARKQAGKPPRIVSDWTRYMRVDLRMTMPQDPPDMVGEALDRYGFDADELIEHFEAVYTYNYKPHKLAEPQIHIVKLVASDGNPVDRPGGAYQIRQLTWLKKIPREFGGRFDLLRGAKTMEDLLRYNPLDD